MDPRSAVKLNDGQDMPIIGFGTEGMSGQDASDSVARALDHGFRLIDTAESFINESEVGEGIRASDVPREEIFITTKISPDNVAKVRQAVKERCQLLGVEYVDLCLIDSPPDTGAGGDVWQELADSQRAGLCRSIGVCGYSFTKIGQLIDHGGVKPAVNQIEASPFGFEPQLLEECDDSDIALQACSPLTKANLLQDETLKTIAKKHDKKTPQVLLRWSIQKGMAPLPKSTQIDHMRENYDVFDFKLTSDEMETLDGLNEHYSAAA